MTKEEAIAVFGPEAVKQAQSMYETDFGKIFFEEDCVYAADTPLDSAEQLNYLYRAHTIIRAKTSNMLQQVGDKLIKDIDIRLCYLQRSITRVITTLKLTLNETKQVVDSKTKSDFGNYEAIAITPLSMSNQWDLIPLICEFNTLLSIRRELQKALINE